MFIDNQVAQKSSIIGASIPTANQALSVNALRTAPALLRFCQLQTSASWRVRQREQKLEQEERERWEEPCWLLVGRNVRGCVVVKDVFCAFNQFCERLFVRCTIRDLAVASGFLAHLGTVFFVGAYV
jgi:hypothetical protein